MKPDIKIKRSGKNVNISMMTTLTAEQVRAIQISEMKHGETVTFDFTATLDIDELAKIIDKTEAPPSSTGWASRIAEAVATEGLKTAIREVVVQVGKALLP